MQAFRQLSKDDDVIDITKINGQSQHHNQSQKNQMKPHEQFLQYKKIYLTAYILATQKQRLLDKANQLIECLQQIQNSLQDFSQADIERGEDSKRSEKNTVKRSRRKADDIQRKWECREQYCGRKYGAHASLLQHVKLKHPTVYQLYC